MKLKKMALLSIGAMILSVSAVSSARAGHFFSAKTHIYVIEYHKPDSESKLIHKNTEDPHTLNLLFLVKVDAEKAEALLRSELARLSVFFPPEGDILAAAYTRLTDDPADEKIIYFTDGSCHLVFSKEKNMVLTSRELLGI